MADELLFTVSASTAHKATPITLAEAGLRERQDLQEWVLQHPDILGSGVKVVTFEFDRWWSTSGAAPLDRLDVLGLDDTGHLVVCELKRDNAPVTIEMQAIKYAAMASRFTLETLASQHARFLSQRGEPCTADEALERLTAHAEDVSSETLAQPRIVLVAASFPPVVTATVVWLTEMSLDITLVQYRAYQTDTQVLLSVSQLYPVPDVEDFTVSPRQAEVRAAAETKKRTQDLSTVRRLVNAGTLEDGAVLTVQIRTDVNAEIREALEEWLADDDRRRQASWQNKPSAPLVWAADGQEYSPSGLVSHMVAEATGLERRVSAIKWWVDQSGHDLAELSVTGKQQAYLAFWTHFLARVHREHPEWSRAEIPQPANWLNLPSPIKGTVYVISFAAGGLRAELYIDSGDADENLARFRALEAQRGPIEEAYGGPLVWEELPGRQACRIADYGHGDAADIADHDAYVDWFFDRLGRLRSAMGGIAASLPQ